MDKLIRSLIEQLQRLEKMDKAALAKEFKEFLYFINKQVFKQIPSLSAIGGLLVGAWVSSTFTTSPIKGTLASLGLIKGGKHVVSSATYTLLAIILPILSAALTAYIIQKTLKSYREKQLQRNMAAVAGLGKEVQAKLQEKLALLEKAREAGIVSESEYHTKRAGLYQSYSRTLSSRIEEIVIDKLS
ncbi:MAG: hypothetical protein HY954_11390 [Deltaproteobacteria bacterium]|nr:hypothetical protein [Deltaproteobacteria bacterium]